ncbi:MAG: carbamate kinase [Candidatus Riflebacteria bacterium]|nr:carbamate kinase [Candidatus Riflebacteria bacterium]
MLRSKNDDSSAKKLVVLALGGNALQKKGEKGTVYEQFANTRESMKPVVELMKKNYNFVITHGNGPQVGAVMLMVDKARDEVPETPLGIADAMTCGSMGYMIEQSLQNIMIKAGIWRNVVTIPAQIIVDPNDPSIKNPTKPIGKFYSEEEAKKLESDKGWVMKNDANRGYRRYVASPYPLDIVEKDAIKSLISQNYVVVTGGGGGIPVYYEKDKTLEGIDCVIDKDLATMKIALAVNADTLVIVTGVNRVAVNFGKPNQEEFSRMTLAQARYYLAAGEFPPGSMGPKIQAAIEFVQANPNNRVVITDIACLPEALEGKQGTTIVAY